MPTIRVTSSTVAQALWSQQKHCKGKISAVNIDNQSTAPRTLRIQDVFTPDASVGEPSPVETTKERLQVTIPAGQSALVDERSLKDIEILGAAKLIGDAISTVCICVVNYDFE